MKNSEKIKKAILCKIEEIEFLAFHQSGEDCSKYWQTEKEIVSKKIKTSNLIEEFANEKMKELKNETKS